MRALGQVAEKGDDRRIAAVIKRLEDERFHVRGAAEEAPSAAAE